MEEGKLSWIIFVFGGGTSIGNMLPNKAMANAHVTATKSSTFKISKERNYYLGCFPTDSQH